MKVLLLNGSPHEHGCTYTALMECAGALQTMRTLGTNMAWFLNMRQGRELPDFEPGIATNFIR